MLSGRIIIIIIIILGAIEGNVIGTDVKWNDYKALFELMLISDDTRFHETENSAIGKKYLLRNSS